MESSAKVESRRASRLVQAADAVGRSSERAEEGDSPDVAVCCQFFKRQPCAALHGQVHRLTSRARLRWLEGAVRGAPKRSSAAHLGASLIQLFGEPHPIWRRPRPLPTRIVTSSKGGVAFN